MNVETYTYRGWTATRHPAHDRWIIDFKGRYGAYAVASKARVRKLVDGYFTEEAKLNATRPEQTRTGA